MENFSKEISRFFFCLVSLLCYFITVQQGTTTTTPIRKEKKSFDESSPRSRDIGVNKEVKTSKSGVKKEIVTVSSIFLPHDKLGFDSEGFPMINPTSFVVNTTTSNTTTTILNKTKPFITKEVINFNSSQRILFEDLTRQ